MHQPTKSVTSLKFCIIWCISVVYYLCRKWGKLGFMVRLQRLG